MEKCPRISVLINTHNRENYLPNILDGVFNQNYSKENMEIIILNDASTDNTAKVLENYSKKFKEKGFSNFRIYTNEINRHIAFGRCFLSSKISDDSKAVVFMDDDVFLEKDCVKNLAEKLFEKENIGIVGPKIAYYEFPDKTAHCAGFVNFWTGQYEEFDSEKEIECDWLNSSCFLVKKTALIKSGGFYPGFYVSHQEVDFCLKVKKAGFKALYFPLVKALHDIELKKRKTERLYYIYRNKMLVIRRNFPFLNKVFALSLIAVLGLPKYIFESISSRKKVVFSEIRVIFLAVVHGLLGREGIKTKD